MTLATVSSPVAQPAPSPLSMVAVVQLLELIPDAGVLVWTDGRIAAVNEQAELLFGYAAGTLVGESLEVLVPDRARAHHPGHRIAYLAAPRKRAMGADMDLAARRRDGTEFPAEIALSQVLTEGGELALATVRDVSKRRRADEASWHLAAIVQSSQEAIVSKDPAGVITSWNPGAELLYGFSADQMIGQHVARLVATDLWLEQEGLFRRALKGERIEDYETRRLRRDGTSVDVSVTLSPILDERGVITGVASIARDISARRQARRLGEEMTHAMLNILEDFTAERDRLGDTQSAVLNILDDFDTERQNVQRVNSALREEIAQRSVAEAALLAKTSELTNSNAELEQFAYVASHDLQEPLRKIASFCQLLARRYQGRLDDGADQYIGYVVDGATRMQQLIDDLLAFARLGQALEEPVLVDCEIPLRRALENLDGAIEASGADVRVSTPLPTVLGHPSRLVQLFQNLIGNSLKFRGQHRPRIEISAVRDGDRWQLSIADNGIGIEAQFEDRVFSVFQRLHTRDEYPGTGIGLAICRKIVDQMGGRIWFESEPGRGTTFSWTAPVRGELGGQRDDAALPDAAGR